MGEYGLMATPAEPSVTVLGQRWIPVRVEATRRFRSRASSWGTPFAPVLATSWLATRFSTNTRYAPAASADSTARDVRRGALASVALAGVSFIASLSADLMRTCAAGWRSASDKANPRREPASGSLPGPCSTAGCLADDPCGTWPWRSEHSVRSRLPPPADFH